MSDIGRVPFTKDTLKELFLPAEKVAIFVDGANLYHTAKALNLEMDYQRVRKLFAECGRLVRCYYYTGVKSEGTYDSVQKLVDWLDQNGWAAVTKPVKFQGEHGTEYTIKGNMDVEMTVDMLRFSAFIDHIVLFSGDGDFCYLVDDLQQRGKRVTVVSTKRQGVNVLSRDLARQADNFVDLFDLTPFVARDAQVRTRASLAATRKETQPVSQD